MKTFAAVLKQTSKEPLSPRAYQAVYTLRKRLEVLQERKINVNIELGEKIDAVLAEIKRIEDGGDVPVKKRKKGE